jgi:aspartate aminotransferase
MKLSQRVAKLTPSITMAVSAKAKALQAQGFDVIDFGAGEPDFDTPAFIREAAIKAMQSGMTRYTPPNGLLALRQAVADSYRAEHGLNYAANNVVITCGAKQALFNLFQLLLDPGDEVIVPAPYWVSYPEMIWLAGGVAKIVDTTEATSFRVTADQLRAAITPRTKALLLNYPSNPTGAAYSRADLAALAAVLVDRDIWTISDEVYEYLIYDNFKFVCFPTVNDKLAARTVVVSGASKTYAMTGWRIGWAVGPADIIEMMSRFQSQSTSNATSFAQAGAIAALKSPRDWFAPMHAEYVARRDYMVDRLNALPGVQCFKPEGAFYVFPRVDSYYGKSANGKAIDGSLAMCDYLIEQAKIAATPGVGFGQDANIRLSYATSMAQIEAGLDRLERALAAL